MENSDYSLNKSVNSLIDEIKSQDIYTISATHSSQLSLPTLSSLNLSDSLIDRENAWKKSSVKCRSIFKKLSVQEMKRSILNLPALVEEEQSYFPSFPMCSLDLSQYNTQKSKEAIIDKVGIGNMPIDDESWVDLSKQANSSSSSEHSLNEAMPPVNPERNTSPPFGNGEEYLRLLREAQKESNQSSARVSLASSRRDTPRDSPKSPPNSPNTELAFGKVEPSVGPVYINYYNGDGEFVGVEKNVESDWIWDWSSRPDQTPPKEWRFVHPKKSGRRGASIRRMMVGNSSLFSRNVLYTLFITNVLSLLLGTGIGLWLSKRSGGGTTVATISAVPLN